MSIRLDTHRSAETSSLAQTSSIASENLDARAHRVAKVVLQDFSKTYGQLDKLASLKARISSLQEIKEKLSTTSETLRGVETKLKAQTKTLEGEITGLTKNQIKLAEQATKIATKLADISTRLNQIPDPKPLTFFQKFLRLIGLYSNPQDKKASLEADQAAYGKKKQEIQTELKKLEDQLSTKENTVSQLEAGLLQNEKLLSELSTASAEVERAHTDLKAASSSFQTKYDAQLTNAHTYYQRHFDAPLTSLRGTEREEAVDMRARHCAFRMFQQQNAIPKEISKRLSGSTLADSVQSTLRELSDCQSIDRVTADRFKSLLQTIADIDSATVLVSKAPATEKPLLIAGLVDKILDKLEALPPGGRLLLPGGYQNEGGGHAVLYEITRQEGEGFSFNVYNTGEGSGIFSTNVREYPQATEKTLKNPEFWKGLLEFTSHSYEGTLQTGLIDGEMAAVHDHLGKHLGAERSGKSIPSQSWGNCTHTCLRSWISTQVSETSYRAFHEEMRSKAASRCQDLLPTLNAADRRFLEEPTVKALQDKVKIIQSDSMLTRGLYYGGQMIRGLFSS